MVCPDQNVHSLEQLPPLLQCKFYGQKLLVPDVVVHKGGSPGTVAGHQLSP